ncbi:MAG TPA: ABC transporter permease [Solirubrobacteraceae bacterium]|jgi:peptide/nickel transport system permease protein|nr:ABC transporter permease [Solirubrobacteraceae bacterium]
MSAIGSEIQADVALVEQTSGKDAPAGIGPYRLAWRRLRRNKVALFFGCLFILLVILCLLAPVYSQDIAHIGPNTGNLTGQIKVGGKLEYVLSLQGIPIGPTWNIHHYFLGADTNGRDVAVRLLYGGRSSLFIGVVAMLITMFFGTALGIIAGYFRGFTDGLISRASDVVWSYPAVLLGITLGTVLNVRGLGPFHSTTLLSTALVVGFVYIPYVVRPIRAQVLTLREREFVDAARQQGMGHLRIMFSELLPNVASTIIVFIPLMLANAIILEAALDYLGAGVQAPNSSWGTMIQAGLQTFPGAFHTVLAPGIMLVLAVMSVNIFGDGLRDALDPRSKAA